MSPTNVKCPVCGVPCPGPPLYRYSPSQAAAHFCPPTRDPDRHARLKLCLQGLWPEGSCVILQCPDCGFAFGYPFIGGDECFYSILHEQKGYPKWRWDYDIALAKIRPQINGGRVLDFGAGVGNFLKGLPANWRLFAIESTDSNRTDLRRRGITVFSDLQSAVERETGTFQIITVFQVLEHISSFDEVLAQCGALLAPGGTLIITVPDGDAMIRQERLTGCHDMPPNHINKWTPKSLAMALRKAQLVPTNPVYEPSSLKQLFSSLHLRFIAEAVNPSSTASRIYQVRNRNLRKILMGAWSIPALVGMTPVLPHLFRGGAFAMYATPNPQLDHG